MRVVYKPVRRFREQTGLVSKSVLYTYKQVTELTNNRQEPAIVTFTDHIPLSRDTRLKVQPAPLIRFVYNRYIVMQISSTVLMCTGVVYRHNYNIFLDVGMVEANKQCRDCIR